MPVLALVAVTVGVVGVVYGISRLVGADSEPLREAPFGSGLLPNEHALSRFHVCWHTLTILFSAFDMEIGLMHPWTRMVAAVGSSAVIELFSISAVLLAEGAYPWRGEAMRWA